MRCQHYKSVDSAMSWRVFTLSVVLLLCGLAQQIKGEECLALRASYQYLKKYGETYVNIGKYTIPERISDQRELAEIAMEVMVDHDQHDGILVAIGNTPNFKYYEWKKKAVHTVFLVVEFVYSALSLLLKAEGHPYLEPIEVFKTYPTPYNISDGRWHRILVRREGGVWLLAFDDIRVSRSVTPETDVRLVDKEVHVGGRPGYMHWQLKGMIRKLHINKRPVIFNDKSGKGEYEVMECESDNAKRFMSTLVPLPRFDPPAKSAPFGQRVKGKGGRIRGRPRNRSRQQHQRDDDDDDDD